MYIYIHNHPGTTSRADNSDHPTSSFNPTTHPDYPLDSVPIPENHITQPYHQPKPPNGLPNIPPNWRTSLWTDLLEKTSKTTQTERQHDYLDKNWCKIWRKRKNEMFNKSKNLLYAKDYKNIFINLNYTITPRGIPTNKPWFLLTQNLFKNIAKIS